MLMTFTRGLLARVAASFVAAPQAPRFVGRCRTLDSYTAFPFRMGAGFAGSVNRSHPMSVEPAQMDPDNPVLGYGLACVASAANPNTIRSMAAGDGALTKIYGISVRPYPVQQTTGGLTAAFGTGVPPTDQPLDLLTSGYIMVPIVGAPAKGDPVYVWVAASAAPHIQGGFESAADGGNTILLADTLANIEFNGPPDANGIGEIRFRI